ncbi:retrovirus-related Pol polyprotein from transposon 297 [Trichonephila clavipes]|nr:retrovirus-related Pol polyprotein from transposon 297 [Trichonephila clavipes]
MEPEEERDLVTEHMFKLISRLKRCQEVAINKMEEMQVKRKTWYDKNAVKREFKDGDLDLVLATSRANKLAVQWIGPGTILNKISETNYLVEIPGRREIPQIYHINMLKPYYKRPEHVNGYWQIPLSKTAQRYAAFCTSFGTYRPLRMSFGLKNAPYFFSKLMAELLNGLEDFVVPYLDDIAIFSDTWESHIKHMETVLQRIKRAKLTIKPSKCKFAQQNVKFLGHIVGQGFRTSSEIEVQAVLQFPTPRTKTQIRAFLGLAGYYQKYINLFSVIAAPLTDALKGRAKKGEIKWTTECENAFRELKGKLIDKPVSYAPNFEREFIVQTDASNAGMGAVLTQLTEQGEEHPIFYLSKKFSEVEKRYCTTEKECASIVFAIKRLHYYLDGNSSLVMTDHNLLVWLNRNVSSNSRLLRWALALQPYNFRLVHRSGKSHKNADSLSRSVIDN